jgi:hypothetical protein
VEKRKGKSYSIWEKDFNDIIVNLYLKKLLKTYNKLLTEEYYY